MIVKKTEFCINSSGKFQAVSIKDKPQELDIRRGFRDIFEKARLAQKSQVSFGPVGLQEGFPVIGVAKIAAQEILRFCRACPDGFKKMVLVIKDQDVRKIFEDQIYGYLRHVQDDLGSGPYCTVDMIIEYQGGIVVIERSNPPYGLALPGGFVDNGESLEHAARREAKEETNLHLIDLKQFHTYSDPRRDPRFQTISTVFVAKGKGFLRSGDDARSARVIFVDEMSKYPFAFDHKRIIRDYCAAYGKA